MVVQQYSRSAGRPAGCAPEARDPEGEQQHDPPLIVMAWIHQWQDSGRRCGQANRGVDQTVFAGEFPFSVKAKRCDRRSQLSGRAALDPSGSRGSGEIATPLSCARPRGLCFQNALADILFAFPMPSSDFLDFSRTTGGRHTWQRLLGLAALLLTGSVWAADVPEQPRSDKEPTVPSMAAQLDRSAQPAGPSFGRPCAVPDLGLEMVWIKAGNFIMGSPRLEIGRYDDEGPQTRVTLTGGTGWEDTK